VTDDPLLVDDVARVSTDDRNLALQDATTSPEGPMMLAVFAGIAEFDRTSAGREAAKRRGVHFGRPPTLTSEKVMLGRRVVDEGASVRAAAKVLRCHRATLHGAVGARGDAAG
jgi:DNA invertase Pin-like site-specific DNA recombinase